MSLIFSTGCGSAIIGALLALQPKAAKKRTPSPQDGPPTVYILPISGVQNGDVTVTYILIDQGGDRANITIEFSQDKGQTYNSTTESSSGYSEGAENLSTSPSGVPHIFIWDSKAPGNMDGVVSNDVRIRITPQDHDGKGTPVEISISLDNNDPPKVSEINVPNPANGAVVISYTLTDTESDTCSITVQYSTDGGVNYQTATEGTGGDGQTGLASSDTGIAHTFVWDSFVDLGYARYTNVKIKITPADVKSGVAGESEVFEVNNNEAPIAQVNTPTTEQSGNVFLTYKLFDSNSDAVNIQVEWWDPFDANPQWKPATEVTGAPSEGVTNLSSSPGGTSHIFVWNSLADMGVKYSNQIRIRIKPSDVLNEGTWAESGGFAVSNNDAPLITFVQTPSGVQVSNVLITYYLADTESDNCSIKVFYSDDGGLTWKPASEVAGGGSGDGTTNLASAPAPGVEHKFDWDAQKDLAGKYETDVKVRVVANDGYRDGPAGTTNIFTVDGTTPPQVSNIVTPSGTVSGNVALDYTLTDAESQQCSIVVEYTRDMNNWYAARKGTGGDPLTGLSSSPSGVVHTFIWDTLADNVGTSGTETVWIRFTVSDTKTGNTETSGSFNVNNMTGAPWVEVTTPTGEQSGAAVIINYKLYDPNDPTCSIEVEFWDPFVSLWKPATMGAGGDGTSNLSASPSGTLHGYSWNSVADLGNKYTTQARIRIRPYDGTTYGSWVPTDAFVVANNAAPSVTIVTPSGPQRGDVTISYKLFDNESDSCSIMVEYSDDGGATYKPATKGPGGDGVTGLTSSPSGTSHTYVWDSIADIGGTSQDDIRIRITPNDGYRNGTPAATDNFTVSNVSNVTWNGNVDDKWDTAGNWDGGIPTPASNVTIPSDRPRYPTLIHSATILSLTVASGANLTLKGDFTFSVSNDVTIGGTLIMDSNWTQTVLSVGGNLTLLTSAKITAKGKGWPSGVGLGPGEDGDDSGGGGGGHGGYGGYGSSWSSVGVPYDSVTQPSLAGSGGGSGNNGASPGGNGGGAIKIVVKGTFSLGTGSSVSANGSDGVNGGGGGAGGSIWVDCNVLTGSGVFEAKGGNASGSPQGGGGGGGKIAIYYNDRTGYSSTLSCSVAGGSGYSNVSYMYGSLIFVNKNGTDNNPSDDDLYIHHNTHLNEIDYSFRDVNIATGVQVCFDSYSADRSGCPQLTLKATGNMTVSSGATLTANGLGYPGSEGPGAGGDDPQGTGTGGHGGGHGGYGGRGDGNTGNPLGAPYGDFLKPTTSGSGGGHGDGLWGGGEGGGAIRLDVSGTLTLNGVISANGSNAWNSDAGGGAGGSIWITCHTLTGSGYCTANGGSGNDDGGGGAGGRIAIHYVNRTGYSGQNSCKADGGAKGSGVDNPYGAGACGSCVFVDTKGTETTSDDDIHIYTNCRITQNALSCANITLYNAVTFFVDSHAAGDVQVVITVSGNVSIPAGCSISASELGYIHSQGPGQGTDGAGAGASGAGGGYGGNGGQSSSGAAGGTTYGDSTSPVDCGSGGGDRTLNSGNWGGAGGGSIKLVVGGNVSVDGSITANGESAKYNGGGGGSGGSIWLVCNTLSGGAGGSITANGGNGKGGGGGGGGGRIRIQRNTSTFSGTKTVNGGSGAGGGDSGEAGTIVEP